MSASIGSAVDGLSEAAEGLRVAGERARREDVVLAALLVASVVFALREGFADLAELREVTLRVGSWGANER